MSSNELQGVYYSPSSCEYCITLGLPEYLPMFCQLDLDGLGKARKTVECMSHAFHFGASLSTYTTLNRIVSSPASGC